MIDIVTVVFEQEIPVLRAQAQSIALNCQRIGIRNIYVVLNDSETIAAKLILPGGDHWPTLYWSFHAQHFLHRLWRMVGSVSRCSNCSQQP
jgi:hypothetical protein